MGGALPFASVFSTLVHDRPIMPCLLPILVACALSACATEPVLPLAAATHEAGTAAVDQEGSAPPLALDLSGAAGVSVER